MWSLRSTDLLPKSTEPMAEINSSARRSSFDLDTSLSLQMDLLPWGTTLGSQEWELEEVRTTPLFSTAVKKAAERLRSGGQNVEVLPEFGLFAGRMDQNYTPSNGFSDSNTTSLPAPQSLESVDDNIGLAERRTVDPRLFLNVNAPWSTFICGSQGSGKSHSLSCMLENCLLPDKSLGQLSVPLTGLLLHYDSFTSAFGGQPCEAAYLASSRVPVTVLVSISNLNRLKQLYHKVNPDITVRPLLIDQKYLTAENFMTMMAAGTIQGSPPLYMQTVLQILRDMALEPAASEGVDYKRFEEILASKTLTPDQRKPLQLRLDLLESFTKDRRPGIPQRQRYHGSEWSPKSGALTIIDLSCPFVDSDTACALFEICTGIFVSQDHSVGKIVALDEAHKYMTTSAPALKLTETLKTAIRLQRHLACRIIVATQEPTIAPSLLDLCSVTLVHRFSSPGWFKTLKGHLAAVAEDEDGTSKAAIMMVDTNADDGIDNESEKETLFGKIVKLNVGEALLFSPSAMLDVKNIKNSRAEKHIPIKLGTKYLKIRIRSRVTEDGGRSVVVTR